MKGVKIFLASDHAGFKLKEKIKLHLEKNNISYGDFGTYSSKTVDYPDYIIPAVEEAVKTKSLAIVLGGSGQGEAIVANKVKGTRAVVLYKFDKKIITLSKEHNNANVLSLGARFLSEKDALKTIDLWLKSKFSKETRHIRRLKKISRYEK